MPAGDASRTWFSEMVEALRQEWKPEMGWEQVIAVRDHLDAMLNEMRFSRGIRPPTMWCPVCNRQTQQAPPSVSVRALILALARFGIVTAAEVKSLEKRWSKRRKENSLDRNGKPDPAVSTGFDFQGPNHHSHGPPHDDTSTPAEITLAREAREHVSEDGEF
jgi:hypothetical protein